MLRGWDIGLFGLAFFLVVKNDRSKMEAYYKSSEMLAEVKQLNTSALRVGKSGLCEKWKLVEYDSFVGLPRKSLSIK